MVIAVISVCAVCGFNKIKTSLLRIPFSRRNNHFRVLLFLRISADQASGAYRQHAQASELPKPSPLGIPRPIVRQKINGTSIRFFVQSVLYYLPIRVSTVA